MTRNNLNQTHPWHHVSFGKAAPSRVNAVIEIPKGSRAKYELDKESGMLIMDRVLYSAMYYPANYGFIPQTYCDDKDPLDILVLSQIDVVPFCIVPAKVIGVMQMLDNGEADDKIISVCETDMSVNHIEDITDLPEHFLHELRNFFEDYKKLEKKEVVVEEFLGREKAEAIVEQALADYRLKFPAVSS
ncbi:MAG: inorganic diphosphatase [Bacteroidota bacterium]